MRKEDAKAIRKWADERGIEKYGLSVFELDRPPRDKGGFTYTRVDNIPGLTLDKGMAVYLKVPITSEEPTSE